ncbi:hypothetical protein EMCG_08707 [[Emmonsia] crescens]|uniref:Uncharacterized protein n=1 Tax=[Emmonsia] crescens TaxID=73230 RepID=A0A0G2I5G8_9EURO|nr:hypothetical protein EMCG_08707 [Emmonsia crescens UAMH 3008]
MDIEADSACITLPNQLRRHLGSIETRGPIVCTLYRSGDCSQDSTLRDIYDGDDNLFASGVGRNAESVRCQFRS